MILTDGISLYHGSYCAVHDPDLNKCRSGKDFGRGFYLTTDRNQAIKFTKTSMRKAISDGVLPGMQVEGYVSEFIFSPDKDLNIYEFADADSDWLHCVAYHRNRLLIPQAADWSTYDIIAGKIANDTTNLVLTTYMDGLYGEVGSVRADRIAIDFLEPGNLRDQVCFRTQKALNCLIFQKEIGIRL